MSTKADERELPVASTCLSLLLAPATTQFLRASQPASQSMSRLTSQLADYRKFQVLCR